jgi:hypothetical protein
MRARRFASFCLGLWLGGGMLLAWIFFDRPYSLERAAQRNSSLADAFKKLGPQGGRVLDRIDEEQSLDLRENWERIQLTFGVLLFLYLLLGSKVGPLPLLGVLIMVCLAAGQLLILTPDLHSMIRSLDSGVLRPSAKVGKAMWVLRTCEVGIDALKYGIALILVARFSFSHRGRGSEDARDEINLVNEANYRHINR